MERLSIPLKSELVETLITRAGERIEGGQDASVHLAALGSLLNRAPFYAGPETVLSRQWVERAFDAFSTLDWSPPAPLEMRNLFLMAARLVDDRSVDLDKALRKKIANKLEKAGVPPAKCQRLLQFVPLGETDRTSLYGEALPRGLILQPEMEFDQRIHW